MRPPRRPFVALAAVLLLVLTTWPAAPATAAVYVSERPAVAWGVNGTVFATRVVGDTVLVGGSFSAAVAPNGATVPRRNLAAFSLGSGALLGGWRADTDGTVRALAVAGLSVWVGGDFSSVGGRTRRNLAKVSLGSGAVDPGFRPSLTNARGTSAVRAILTDGSHVFAGGSFTRVNGGTAFPWLVKLDAGTGTIARAFDPQLNGQVWSLARARAGATVYAGGAFSTLNGFSRPGVAGINPVWGGVVGPALGGVGAPGALALAVSADGSVLYGGLTSNRCLAWRTRNGTRRWTVTTDGNVQAVRLHDGILYCGFHDGYRDDSGLKALAVRTGTGLVDPDWRPSINSFLGVFAISASSRGLVLGGAFTVVSGRAARRVALFRA